MHTIILTKKLSLRVTVDEIGNNGADVGVIVSCAVGASVCILLIVITVLLIISNRRQAKRDTQRQRILSDRMQRVWLVHGCTARMNGQ